MKRRHILPFFGSMFLYKNIQASEAYIPKNIKIIVPATPGSSTDVFARAISILLAEKTGSVVIVENSPGVSSMLGSAQVAKSPKDGSVLLINSSSLFTAATAMEKPMLDVMKDLTPVAIIEKNPLVVAVSNQSGIQSPSDLIQRAKTHPEEITHGTLGIGTIADVAEKKLSSIANVKFKNIPYKGTSLAVTDMAGGTIDMVIATHSSVSPAIKAGRAKIIAITSLEENKNFPGIPTMASAAPGFSVDLMLMLFAPSGTPPAIIKKYNVLLNEIMQHEKMTEMMSFDGGIHLPFSPEELQGIVRKEYESFKTQGR